MPSNEIWERSVLQRWKQFSDAAQQCAIRHATAERLSLRVDRLCKQFPDVWRGLRCACDDLEGEPERSTLDSAVALETVLKHLHTARGDDPRTARRGPSAASCHQMVSALLPDVPERIVWRAHTVREGGNRARHREVPRDTSRWGAPAEQLTPEDARATLESLCVVLEWFASAYRGPWGTLKVARLRTHEDLKVYGVDLGDAVRQFSGDGALQLMRDELVDLDARESKGSVDTLYRTLRRAGRAMWGPEATPRGFLRWAVVCVPGRLLERHYLVFWRRADTLGFLRRLRGWEIERGEFVCLPPVAYYPSHPQFSNSEGFYVVGDELGDSLDPYFPIAQDGRTRAVEYAQRLRRCPFPHALDHLVRFKQAGWTTHDE